MSTSTIFRIEYLSANNEHKSNYANGFLDAASATASNSIYSEVGKMFVIHMAENIQRQNNIDLFDGSFDRNSYGFGWLEGFLAASNEEQYLFVEELFNSAAEAALKAWFGLTSISRPLVNLANRSLSMGL